MVDTSDLIARLPTSHYVEGRWVGGPRTLDVVNPATGPPITQVADASGEVALAALGAPVAARAEKPPETCPRG